MDSAQITFGPFRFDRQRQVLTRRGAPVAVGQKALVLLDALLAADGRPVAKSVLMEAAWPGLVVEDSNLSVQIAALRKALGQAEDGGEWITTVQRFGYQLIRPLGAPGGPHDAGSPAGAGLPSDRPSIAVMPFLNLSSDAAQAYFSDGIVEEIIIALSQMRWLTVISRNSSFAYKDRAYDVKQIGAELGVRYVLEGTVRSAGGRLRITAQLSEADTATNIWAGRFEGQSQDVFDLQDRVTASVIGAIAPKLEAAEIDRVRRKPTASHGAYDHFLRGMMGFHAWSRQGSTAALQCFYQAIDIDPDYAAAHGLAARVYVQRLSGGWMDDAAHERREAIRLAERAAELGRDDAVSLAMAGFALSDIAGRVEDGDYLIDRALSLNANLAWAWLFSSWVKSALGQPDLAIERVRRAAELSPNDPHSFSFDAARAYAQLMTGQLAEAHASAEAALRQRPEFLLYSAIAAVAAALRGNRDEAGRLAARLRATHPAATMADLVDLIPLRRPEDRHRWAAGLQLAGLTD